MSDAQLRARQRAWEGNPGDQDALAAYIAALRGAGEFVPLELLSQRVFPARTLDVSSGWSVSVELLGGTTDLVELTPSGSQVEVPEHRRLVVAFESPEALRSSSQLLAGQGVLELALDCEGLTGPALAELTQLLELEVLQLFGASHLCGEDWTFLGRCSSLHTLATDHLDLAKLEGLPTSLQVLRVRALDASTLEMIVELAPGLRCVEFSGEDLSEEDYARLRGLARLSSLRIDQPLSFTLEALIELASLELETISLGRGTELPEETLQHIADLFPRLQNLELAESFEDLQPLSALSLERLHLVRFVGARQLIEDTLAGLPTTIRSLHLSASLGDSGLRALARLSEVTDLDLDLSPDLRGPGLIDLAGLSRVRTLRLSAPALEAEAFDALLAVEALTDLDLFDTADDQVARLGRLRRLRSLRVSARYDETLSPTALACLESLPLLESLNLVRARVGRSLSTSHGLQNLQDLSIFASEVSKEAIADIGQCKRLWFLTFLSCGPLEGVEALAALPTLQTLSFSEDAALSEATVAHLQANLPDGTLDVGP